MTNDFNLNKVADLHGVSVLNINDLANAVKPVVIPGEDMHVVVIKDGKEHNQGVAYLDDGTMIVVEDGKFHIGNAIDVSRDKCVTNIRRANDFCEAEKREVCQSKLSIFIQPMFEY